MCLPAATAVQAGGSDSPVSQPGISAIAKIVVASPAFVQSGTIPDTYTCGGSDISPPVSWSAIPARTKSIALLMDDPDAPGGTFTHWIIYNIPITATGLPENVPNNALLPDGTRQGKNSFRDTGYGGPCPPRVHRYYFKVYALDKKLSFAGVPSRGKFLRAIKGHIVGRGTLMGKYG